MVSSFTCILLSAPFFPLLLSQARFIFRAFLSTDSNSSKGLRLKTDIEHGKTADKIQKIIVYKLPGSCGAFVDLKVYPADASFFLGIASSFHEGASSFLANSSFSPAGAFSYLADAFSSLAGAFSSLAGASSSLAAGASSCPAAVGASSCPAAGASSCLADASCFPAHAGAGGDGAGVPCAACPAGRS